MPSPILIALMAAWIMGAPTNAADTPAVAAARAHRTANAASILDEFSRLLSIPNVSSDRPNLQRNAAFIQDAFRRRGIELELLTVRNAAPLIVGNIKAPGATRTLGIYVHYDGQPVDAARWTTDPWTPTLYDAAIDAGGRPLAMPAPGETVDAEARLYARAAGDDKGPLIAILAAMDALEASDIGITSNIKFMFEGEEEAGSLHLREYFAHYADRLQADVWLICDGPVHQSRQPQIVFGVRGVTSMEITVYGANRYLHSGHYGNWAPNPALMLAELMAGMKDDDGLVVIDGFYDDTIPLSASERAAIAAIPEVDEALLVEFGLSRAEINGRTLVESLQLPSLNIRGFESGAVGATARNVIPSTATAAIDIRMVKGNVPTRMLDVVEEHIRQQGFHIVRDAPDRKTRLSHDRIARVNRGSGYRAARTSMDLPIVEPLIRAARDASGNVGVVLMPSLGGSLPLYLFEEMLESPAIVLPIANHDNNQHGPDENLRIGNLWYGIDLMAAILTME